MAVVDLPDPTQPPPTVNHGSTDDLLSQLAGEEIDRLLADTDADGDAATATPAESPSRLQLAQVVAPPDAAEPAGSLNQITAAPIIWREEASSTPVEAPADLASVLGPLSASANPAASPPPSVAPPAAAPVTSSSAAPVAALPAAVEPTDSAAIVAAELEAADAERHALRGKAAPTAVRDAGIEPDAFDLPDEPAAPALPLFLRPLEWLNAPFANSGDDTRESIGKVALITLVNAVGILIYVFFFRRR